MSADRQLPKIVGVRTAGLSPTAAAALQETSNRSQWIRQAIEAYAAPDEGEVPATDLLSELRDIKELLIQLTKQQASLQDAELGGQDSRSPAVDAAAGILAAFGGQR